MYLFIGINAIEKSIKHELYFILNHILFSFVYICVSFHIQYIFVYRDRYMHTYIKYIYKHVFNMLDFCSGMHTIAVLYG